jgi:outer membrane lipoprotein-sorting protein
MRSWWRWAVTLAVAAATVSTPYLVGARPGAPPELTPDQVVAAVMGSADVSHTGLVESSGTVQVPEADTFSSVATLFGEPNRVRVWWQDGQHWRLDRIRVTGETDLFRSPRGTLRWIYESGRVTVSPPTPVRLPDTSDVLPDTLARRVLQGAEDRELSRLPARRVAGRSAAGVRLVPSGQQSSIDHVDVWADAVTGVPLRVDLYAGAARPALSTHYERLELGPPPAGTLDFDPPPGAEIDVEELPDLAAESDRFAPYVAPPQLADLPLRADRPALATGAVGVYGRGPTVLLFLPLRGDAARPLREQLATTPGSSTGSAGTAVDLGPISVLVTPARYRGSGFLLAGTVTPQTLEQAASQLSDLETTSP